MPEVREMPELVINNPVLRDLKDAGHNLAALLNLIEQHKVVRINLTNVVSITSEYSDALFGAASAECINKGVKMNLFLKNKNDSKIIASIITESIIKSLPTAYGGTATVH